MRPYGTPEGHADSHPRHARHRLICSRYEGEIGAPSETCTIWLGQHGDLSNCIHGLDVCSDGAWTGCIDEDTLAANPDLYGSLAGDK